jgi:hypothetical protein
VRVAAGAPGLIGLAVLVALVGGVTLALVAGLALAVALAVAALPAWRAARGSAPHGC